MFKLLDSLSVRNKLAIIPIVLLSALTIVVYDVSMGIHTQRVESTLINAAGRQRMLNQRYIKEIMHAASGGYTTADDARPAYEKTLQLFKGSLNALTHGGKLIVNPGKGIEVIIPAARNPELVSTLQGNLLLVEKLEQTAMAYLMSAQQGLATNPDELLSLNAELHTQANKAVQLFVRQTDSAIDSLLKTCIYLSVLAAILAIVISYTVSRSITRPLGLFRQRLQAAALGDLSPMQPLARKDEFGQMSTDLSNTVTAVRNALGSDTVDWGEITTLFNDMKADLQSVRAIITQVPTTMLMIDMQGAITYMNPHAQSDVEYLLKNSALTYAISAGDNIAKAETGCSWLWDLITTRQLPFSGVLPLASEHVDVSIHTLLDGNRCSMGTLVSWKIVTDDIKRQQAQALTDAEEARKSEALECLITELHAAVRAASEGDLSQTIPKNDDEKLNDIALTVNRFMRQVYEDMKEIQQNSQLLVHASQQLGRNTDSLEASTNEAHQRTHSVAADSEQVDNYMMEASTATEQMSASIRDIAISTNSADEVAQKAVILTENATDTVQKLFESSNNIGNVLKFITSIAEQTNLLALNATIEAARAGDAGKGFAVVANEVKELAKQTADATDEIGMRISSIQTDSTSAVESIKGINEIVARISDFQGTIATAITQQTAVSREISQTIGNTADNSASIRHHIDDLVKQNQTSASNLHTSRKATKEVVGCTKQLEQLLSHYQLSVAPAN